MRHTLQVTVVYADLDTINSEARHRGYLPRPMVSSTPSKTNCSALTKTRLKHSGPVVMSCDTSKGGFTTNDPYSH